MPVLDKYRPVDATPSSLTPWSAAFGGSLVMGLVLAGFSADTMSRAVIYGEDLAPAQVKVLEGLAAFGESTGLAGLRRTLDAWAAPLDRSARLFLPPKAPLPAEAEQEVPGPPPEPDVPPGERWNATALLDRPQRVLIVGASSIQYAIGTELERELVERYEGLEVRRKGKVSTGLTRDDVFDWPAEIARLMEEFQPDVVIGQFGGNDGQNIVSPTDGPQTVYSDGWAEEYGRRLEALVAQVEGAGAEMIVLGMPRMKSDKFDRKMQWVNGVTKEAVEGAGGQFVDTTRLATDDRGEYVASVRFEGRSGRMRMDDGIHFTRLGGQHVAHGLARKLEREMVLLPKGPPPPEVAETDAPPVLPPPPAVAHRITVESPRRETTPALAYVPRDVPAEGLPVWFLLHGAWDGWEAWPDRAHDALQALSAEHGLVIVCPDGEPFGYWMDSPVQPDHRIGTWFLDDLLPQVDDTLPSNGTRAISGVSMGGHGALTLAMDRPDAFAAATSMSGAVDLLRSRVDALAELLPPKETAPEAWEARSALHRAQADRTALAGVEVLLSVGDADAWLDANDDLHAHWSAQRVDHDWWVQEGGHTWDVWLEALPRHAAFVAEATAPDPPTPPPTPDLTPGPGRNTTPPR